jgi:hypothetical protein
MGQTPWVAGAVSGAGFGVFEAIWVHNQIFALGVTWSSLGNSWLGLWERFCSVAFHITVSAMAGYGLAKGKSWQFYLIAAFLHGLMNYSIIFIEDNLLTTVQDEIVTATFAFALAVIVLWLRWHKTKEIPENNSSTPDTAVQMTTK